MSNDPANKRSGWRPVLAHTVQAVVFAGLAIIGVAALSTVILWDADFYVARDKWETFKVAMFGKWQPNRKSEVTDLLDGIAEFNFFNRVNVAGFGSVMTGAKFNSSEDVINKQPAKRWCYVSIGRGVASRHVELGTQGKSAPPIFSDFQVLPQDVLDELGVSAERLSSLAKANCRFGQFDAAKNQ